MGEGCRSRLPALSELSISFYHQARTGPAHRAWLPWPRESSLCSWPVSHCQASKDVSGFRGPIAAPSGSHLRCSEAEAASGRGQEQALATGGAWGQPAMPGVTAARRVSRDVWEVSGFRQNSRRGQSSHHVRWAMPFLPPVSQERGAKPTGHWSAPPGTSADQGTCTSSSLCRGQVVWVEEGRCRASGCRARAPRTHRLRAQGGRPGSVLPTASEKRGQIPSQGTAHHPYPLPGLPKALGYNPPPIP